MFCLAAAKSNYFVCCGIYAFPVVRRDAIARCEQWGDMFVLSHVFERKSEKTYRPSVNLLVTVRSGDLCVELGNHGVAIRLFGRSKREYLALRACQAMASAAKLFHSIENGTFDPEVFCPARRRSSLNPAHVVRVGLFVAEVYM